MQQEVEHSHWGMVPPYWHQTKLGILWSSPVFYYKESHSVLNKRVKKTLRIYNDHRNESKMTRDIMICTSTLRAASVAMPSRVHCKHTCTWNDDWLLLKSDSTVKRLLNYLGSRCNVRYHNGILQLTKPGFHVGFILIKKIHMRQLKSVIVMTNPIIQKQQTRLNYLKHIKANSKHWVLS